MDSVCLYPADVSTAVNPHSVHPPIFCTVMPVQFVLVSGCHLFHGTCCRWDCLMVHFKQVNFQCQEPINSCCCQNGFQFNPQGSLVLSVEGSSPIPTAYLRPHMDFQYSWCSLICSAPESPFNNTFKDPTGWFKFYQCMFRSCSCHFIWNCLHKYSPHPLHPFLFSQIHKDREQLWAKQTAASFIILAIPHSMWLLQSTHKSHLHHLKLFYDTDHSPTPEVLQFSCSHHQCLRTIFHKLPATIVHILPILKRYTERHTIK